MPTYLRDIELREPTFSETAVVLNIFFFFAAQKKKACWTPGNLPGRSQ